MELGQANTWTRWCVIGLFISGCGMALGYVLFGHTLIDLLYEGLTSTFFDQIITGQHVHPIEHYYAALDRRVLKVVVLLCLLAWGLFGFSHTSSTWLLVLFLSTRVAGIFM
jgi:hypothetical protein